MASTVGVAGMKVRVGNSTFGDPEKEKSVDPTAVKAYSGGPAGFAPERAARIGREIEVICKSKPPYPKELAERGADGVVEMLLDVDKAGVLVHERVGRSSGNSTLDALALQSIRTCTFRPAESDGVKVDARLRYRFRFELYE